MKRITLLLVSFFVILNFIMAQELKVASIFNDHMVMQQQTQTPVWGIAKPGSKVSVTTSWNHKSYSTVTGTDARWKVMVTTTSAGGPYQMEVQGNKKISFKDIYLGEVWLASGQSNMSMELKGYYCQPVIGSNEAILNSGGKNIHFINVPAFASYKPLDEFKAQWKVTTPETAGECSAVGWFFADFIHQHLDVPIGIINTSFGGSSIEAWMSADACSENPEITIPPVSDATSDWLNNVPTVLYNAMIHPLVGYAIKGVIWYQGECNIFVHVLKYPNFFASMVEDWRKKWNAGDFPIYMAQIAPYEYREWNFFTPEFPEISAYIREGQMKCTSQVPNCGMAVLLDVGEPYGIHPSRKKEVGHRLGLLALSKTYGMKGFEAESPQYDSMKVEGNKATIYFKNQFNGLTSFGKKLELFEIAGENKVFIKADAYIDDKNGSVVVSSHLVSEPKAVRYAFKNYAEAELFGTGGLPVSSFRTDNW